MGNGRRKRGYRHRNAAMDGNKIRVRGKRLDEIDDTKLTLAYWLLAKRIVEDRTDGPLDESEVRRVAKELDGDPGEAGRS